MAQVDDEVVIRQMLAELTQDQPPAPPGRYAAVRREAVTHRRRQLAGAAAAVAILITAAVGIPLGLRHLGPPAPAAPSRHYHVTVSPPGPHAAKGLVADGMIDGVRWKLIVERQPGVKGYCTVAGPRVMSCIDDSPQPGSRSDAPASFTSGLGATNEIDIGTVRSDVAYLRVLFNNGQVVTLHPVDVLGSRYARFVAVAMPYAGAVTEVIAFSTRSELGYAIPFTGAGNITLSRWLQPGQPAGPRPATFRIGTGSAHGNTWSEYVYVGPWGTCFAGAGSGSDCVPTTSSLLRTGQEASLILGSGGAGGVSYEVGETAPAVRYLIITMRDGSTARVPPTAAGARRYFTYPSVAGNPVVRWAAYGTGGVKLASGTGQLP
jgi:hypothetical protein